VAAESFSAFLECACWDLYGLTKKSSDKQSIRKVRARFAQQLNSLSRAWCDWALHSCYNEHGRWCSTYIRQLI